MSKNKFFVGFLVFLTLLLAASAIYTSVRLYQLRQESISPVSPESKPKAVVEPIACKSLFFNFVEETPTPTPTPESTPTPTNTPSPTPTDTPTPTNTPAPTDTPVQSTSTPTPTSVTPDQLPKAGYPIPTIISLAAALFIITFSLVLLI